MRGEVYCITGDEIRALSRPSGWLPDTFWGGEGLLHGRVCVFFMVAPQLCKLWKRVKTVEEPISSRITLGF